MSRRGRRLALPLLVGPLVAPGAASAAEAPIFRQAQTPPPGFEAFFERQQTIVDVYYAGRFLVAAPATYDVDGVEFDDPTVIVAALDDLLDPTRIARALSGVLPSNTAALCGRTPTPDCGRLSPETAAVIFDPSRFRADLFVARTELAVRDPGIDRFLPESDAEFSALQNFATAYSGSDDGEDAYNVQSVTSLSWGETHLQMESAWNDNDDITVDALSLRREFRGRVAQAGLYRTRSQSLGFARDRDIVGVRFGSSLLTRADRAFSNGSALTVFLPERARVEILQDGRLLASGAYDAGNQVLDTSSLPEGAYNVDLRIREIGGRERIERRFFVKTTRIPPQDQPIWSVEAGRVVDRNTEDVLPEDADEWFARASYTRRISESFGIDMSTAASAGETIVGAGLYRIDRFSETQASTFVGDSGSHGLAGFSRIRSGRFQLTLDWRLVRGAEDDDPQSLVGGDLDQIGMTLSSALAGGRLALNARFDERGGGGSTNSQGLTWDRFFTTGPGAGFRISVDLSRQDEDWVATTSVQYDFRGDRVYGQIEPGARYDRMENGEDDFGAQTRARLVWERQETRGRLLRMGLSGLGGVAENRVGADGLYEGRFGVLGGQIDRDFDNDDRTTWTGRFNTSLLSDGRSLSLGGRDSARSAALIVIDGDVPNARFEVLVNGFPQGIAPAGSVTPIHLRPWQSYEVRLRPIGDALLAWENRERTITLYPGNVVRLEWAVAEVGVLLGRIVDVDGNAVENARLEGAYGFAVSESGGFFQAEVVRPGGDGVLELIAQRRDAPGCTIRVDLTGIEARRGIYRVGTQRCE